MKYFRIIIISIICILLSFRLVLPYYLLHYVENQINKIPEYHVKINDLDVHLYRGSYTIKSIQLWKIKKNIPVPFCEAKFMDFSLDWMSILHGKFLAKILIEQPKINFVTDPSGKNEQLTISKQWLEIIKSLYPFNINTVIAHRGEVTLRSFKGNPPYEIYVKNVEFEIDNMQEVTKDEKLLSSYSKFTGTPIGGGNITIESRFDPLNKTPTFQVKVKLESLKVVNIHNFLKHYSSIDVIGGIFSLYGEVVAAKGKINGYVKPFIKYLKIGSPKSKDNPVSAIVNGAAKIVANILKNKEKKTVATKINISGKIDDPNTSILSIIGYLIQHAFINAIVPQIDHSVKMQDVIFGKPESHKE